MNLSSPLQRNPLEILMHLQNTYYELQNEEQLPYQQSVLPVDIYLDIERGRRKSEEEQLEIDQKKAKEEYEAQKKIKEQLKTEENQEEKKEKSQEDEDDDSSDSMSDFSKDQELETKLFNLK